MTKRKDKRQCLCCGQLHYAGGAPLTQAGIEFQFALLEAMGYTREKLLNEHLDQIDWQVPGLSTWLRAQ